MTVLQIYRSLMIINATGERNFSKLKLIKNCVRSTLSQNRLNSLGIMAIENDVLEKVIFFLVVLVVGSSAQVGRRPVRRFPIFPQGNQIYAGSLGGAPVGLYSREQPGLLRGRYPIILPRFRQPSENVYLASLGGAKVGAYTRYGGKGGSRVYGASLGRAPVGMYSRES